MRKVIALLSFSLLLTGCSLAEPIPVKGEVVSCESIETVPATDEALECLGGGDAISVDSIQGPALINIWGTWCAPCREDLPICWNRRDG